VIHTELARGRQGLQALEELHAVTLALDEDVARQMVSSATAICASSRAGNPPDGRVENPSSDLAKHGVLFSSPRRLMVGLGVAAVLRVPGGADRQVATRAVSRFIASLPCVDPIRRPGSVATAFGALPFEPSAPGELVIPQVTVVCERGGRSWMTLAGTGHLVAPDLLGMSPGPVDVRDEQTTVPADLGNALRSLDSDELAFTDGVRRALEEIEDGRVEKVVLARKVAASFRRPIDIARTIACLTRREPSSTVFAITSPGDTFIGASPELLVARQGAGVRSVPLAGTVRLTGDRASDALQVARMLESVKENLEHRLVVDAVAATIARFCGIFEVPREPEVISLRQVAHLATRLEASLDGDPQLWPSALELAAALHPTPAVGGSPTATALDLIRSVEPTGRGFYAGPVGWVDANGDGEFFIGIRSAQVSGASASVFAGAGIVAGSDPAEELAETAVKLDTMLGALATS
jgi:menaquinone-specific isochorismate synthase